MKKKLRFLFLVLITVVMLTGCGGDDEGEDPFDFSGAEPKDINPWTYLEDTSIYLNDSLTDLASSSSELVMTVGIMGMVFSIIYIAVRLLFSRNAARREEIRQEAVIKGMIAVMLFSVPFWLGIFKQFSELLI